jgi:hypothetical protein
MTGEHHELAQSRTILVATSGGPTMFARIGVMRALNRGHVREFNPDRKTIIGDVGSWRGIDDHTLAIWSGGVGERPQQKAPDNAGA